MRNFFNHESHERYGFFGIIKTFNSFLAKHTGIFLLVFLFGGVFMHAQDVAVFPQLGQG